jgi:hypothetical protein
MRSRGAVGKKKSDVSRALSNCFFWRLRENFRDFVYHVFLLPLLQNRQKRNKNKSSKNIKGAPKKTEEKGHIFFVMSLYFFPPCFLTPLVTKRPKKRDKKRGGGGANEVISNRFCFCFCAAANIRRASLSSLSSPPPPHISYSTAPLDAIILYIILCMCIHIKPTSPVLSLESCVLCCVLCVVCCGLWLLAAACRLSLV